MEFRLKQLRKSRHISQIHLAMELGMTQNSISRFETGTRRPDYDTLICFADYFDVSIDYLVGRTDIPDLNK
ncbi:MAG: helix-turn-helix transcriptional regulator [Lachnospiraceae bacterium]|nr:helix-turn-helix transcriptional regulator [Lachnospiraceae bacterium]